MSEPKKYTLVTLQDIADQIPSDKIETCMAEIGRGLATAKTAIELTHAVAQSLAKKDGREIPDIKPGQRLFQLPSIFEWIDDDKGEITTHLLTPSGKKFMSIENGEIKI